MIKTPFVNNEQLKEIVAKYPTPFHLYDEKGIRENARRVYKAFSWNKGFKEYFAIKATPNPSLMQILREEGCGADCSSLTELMLCERIGISGNEIMFSSNATPPEEFQLADKLGVSRQTINAIEKGDYNPTIKLCVGICRILGLTLNDLFWNEES